MSKIPDRPKFLDEEIPATGDKKPEDNQAKFNLTKEVNSAPPTPANTPPPPPENKPEQSSESKVSLTTILSLILTVVCLSGATYFYYQAQGYRQKFEAIDARVLVLTKQIAALNQENNTLSGKVVNYQRELENKTGGLSLEELQQKLTETQSKNQDLENQILIYKTFENKSQATTTEIKSSVGKESTKSVINSVTNAKKEEDPTPTKQVVKKSAAFNSQLYNYETQMKNPKQKKCLDYFRRETFKRCTTKNPKLNVLTLVERPVVIQGKTMEKLVYVCRGPGQQGLAFKYGPLEMNNNCANQK